MNVRRVEGKDLVARGGYFSGQFPCNCFCFYFALSRDEKRILWPTLGKQGIDFPPRRHACVFPNKHVTDTLTQVPPPYTFTPHKHQSTVTPPLTTSTPLSCRRLHSGGELDFFFCSFDWCVIRREPWRSYGVGKLTEARAHEWGNVTPELLPASLSSSPCSCGFKQEGAREREGGRGQREGEAASSTTEIPDNVLPPQRPSCWLDVDGALKVSRP